MDHTNIGASKEIQRFLEAHNSTILKTGTTLGELIRRPELTYEMLGEIDEGRPQLSTGVQEQVNINIKYEGYIKRQLKQVSQFKKLESKKIPENIDYEDISGLRIEAKQN